MADGGQGCLMSGTVGGYGGGQLQIIQPEKSLHHFTGNEKLSFQATVLASTAYRLRIGFIVQSTSFKSALFFFFN